VLCEFAQTCTPTEFILSQRFAFCAIKQNNYAVLFYFISFHFISFRFILFYFILFYFILFYFIYFILTAALNMTPSQCACVQLVQ